MITSTIALIFISLLFSAFFSGMEIAFVSSNKLRFEIDKQQKTLTSSVLDIFYSRPDQYISTMLVGNNIALVIYGVTIANLLEVYLIAWLANPFLVTLAQTLISTTIILVTSEFIPKMLFRINAYFWMKTFAFPMLLFYTILYPIATFMSFLSLSIMRLFGVKVQRGLLTVPGRADLDYFLQESVENSVDKEEIENEVKLFQNALDFSKIRLRDCIVPRTEIVAVENTASIDEITEKFTESGCSKLVVYQENLDHIIGYLHSIELFQKPSKWQDRIILAPVVPESMPANKLMNLLLLKKKSMAIVVDEFGGTAGLVTLEDIVEEIFGEIEDEHDTQGLVQKKINDREYILSGRCEIDRVNEQFELDLPESEDYLTIAGWLMCEYQGIPKQKDVIRVEAYALTVLKATQNKIELVKLIKL